MSKAKVSDRSLRKCLVRKIHNINIQVSYINSLNYFFFLETNEKLQYFCQNVKELLKCKTVIRLCSKTNLLLRFSSEQKGKIFFYLHQWMDLLMLMPKEEVL